MTKEDERLLAEARRTREFAYAPYSRFAVGAAVAGASGKIYGGCNVENGAFSLTNCAERTAIFQAVAAGETAFRALAVIADTAAPVSPCGACRQVMAEFRIPRVIMANLAGAVREMTLEEILPAAFEEEA